MQIIKGMRGQNVISIGLWIDQNSDYIIKVRIKRDASVIQIPGQFEVLWKSNVDLSYANPKFPRITEVVPFFPFRIKRDPPVPVGSADTMTSVIAVWKASFEPVTAAVGGNRRTVQNGSASSWEERLTESSSSTSGGPHQRNMQFLVKWLFSKPWSLVKSDPFHGLQLLGNGSVSSREEHLTWVPDVSASGGLPV